MPLFSVVILEGPPLQYHDILSLCISRYNIQNLLVLQLLFFLVFFFISLGCFSTPCSYRVFAYEDNRRARPPGLWTYPFPINSIKLFTGSLPKLFFNFFIFYHRWFEGFSEHGGSLMPPPPLPTPFASCIVPLFK